MNLLYVSYWRAADPLIPSTVVTHLNIVAELPHIEKIFLVTMEQPGLPVPTLQLNKTTHCPLFSPKTSISTFNQIVDFMRHPHKLTGLVKKHKIDLILAKGVLAGALALKASRLSGIPFMVESFEPHADYMAESNEWRLNGLKYNYLRKWEKLQMQQARHLFTVSDHYKDFLQQAYGLTKVDTIPCCVNTEQFKFSETLRRTYRQQLGIKEDEVVGIYVGKFGGIYYEEEAFDIFARSAKVFEKFKLIILTPEYKGKIESLAHKKGLLPEQIILAYVAHQEVPGYLSAADFAFSTIKPAKSRKYCCPVKDGEYWANGLPILLTDGVGDDYRLLQETHAGAIYDLDKDNLTQGLLQIKEILKDATHRSRIHEIAIKYRSYGITRQQYLNWLKPISK